MTREQGGDEAVTGRTWTPWRAVVFFGLVSLAADMVYEGMRSVAGPYLGQLGASAFEIGLVTGAGEAVALGLRLVTGTWADRSRSHWRLTLVGYALTAVAVPLLATAPALGAAGVGVASALILLERTGKAVRSPAKSALLAEMAVQTGRGTGFAVHKALDQVGAVAGPLTVAAVAAATGLVWPGLALLAVPGTVSLVLLRAVRRHVAAGPAAAAPAGPEPVSRVGGALGVGLPGQFHRFSAAAALSMLGLMTFGVISYRLVQRGVLPLAAVPLVYAAAMAVEALSALLSGPLFDRWGGRTLLVVPVLTAAVPSLVFDADPRVVVAGLTAWALATGVQDSTVKAYVADLVGPSCRATAYGVFAAVQGLGALAGGALAGALVSHHVGLLAATVALAQAGAMALIASTLDKERTNVMTIQILTEVTARLEPDREAELLTRFDELLAGGTPDGLVRTELLRGREGTWRIQSLWRDRQALDAMRSAAEPPAAPALFASLGATPTLEILEVVTAHAT